MKIKDQIVNILAYSRQARNSDKELLIIYMQKFGMDLSEKQIDTFRRMPSAETIRRIRQKLQEEGQYQADQTVKRERNFRSYRMQQRTPSMKSEQIETVTEQHALPWLNEDEYDKE